MLRNRLGAVAAILAVGTLAIAAATSAATHRTADAGNVVFLSTQLNAITESEGFRNQIVKGFPGSVDKIDVPLGNATFFPDRIKAESDAGKGTVSLLGGVHGDFPTITQYLMDLSDVAKDLQKAGIPAELFTLGKLGTNKQYYIPWMQASYVMVANKKALTDLPKGADINHLSYGQLFQWAKKHPAALRSARARLPGRPDGPLPALPRGLPDPGVQRPPEHVVQEQVGGLRRGCTSQQLWKYVHPQSLTYNFMQDPLQSGEVMVAWDHVARITSAVRDHPNDYVVFPAPAGPKGRAYLPVLAGLAIPKTAPNAAGAKQLIEFLDGVAPQARLPQVAGFFPVVAGRLSKQVGPGLLAIAAAIKTQQRSKDALASLLPVGLGASGRQLQPRLHRHVHADRDQQGGHQQGPRRRGPEAAGRAQRGGRAVLEAGPAEHGHLPGRSEQLARSIGDGSRAGGAGSAAAAALAGSAVLADPADARLPRRLLRLADGQVVPARLPGRGGQLVDRPRSSGCTTTPSSSTRCAFTLLLVVVIVPLQFVIAFVMALIVNATLKGRGLLLFIFILPLAVSDLAAGLVWQQIFTDHGYLNTILEHLGIIDQPKIWIDPSHSNWLLGEVVLTEMWRSTAFIMIILVAGLQGIPKEFGEAAEVFGAELLPARSAT